MEDLTGKEFGPYRILAPLGEGGMASVFKAYHSTMEREVALKVLPKQYAEQANFVKRFKQEAKVLANLQHPHVLPVFDFGEAEGYTYLVMPLVHGGSLSKQLQGDPLPLERTLMIITQVGDALDYAHSHGLVHRDVKPDNVLLDERGNCLLSDFGIAKMLEGHEKLTKTGGIIGTPHYMSPEQGSGEPVDARSDIYALGVMLYEMATGRTPYNADTPVAVIIKHMQDPLPLPTKLRPELPQVVEKVILKAMAKKPEDRFQTAHEMVTALQAAMGEALTQSVQGPTIGSESGAPTSLSSPKSSGFGGGREGAERGKGEGIRAKPGSKSFLPAAACLGGGLILLTLAVGLFVALKLIQAGGQKEGSTPTLAAQVAGSMETPLAAVPADTAAPPTQSSPAIPSATAASAEPNATATPTMATMPIATIEELTSDTIILPSNAARLVNEAVIDGGGGKLTWSPDNQTLAIGSTLYTAPDFQTKYEVRRCYDAVYSPDFQTMACDTGEEVQLVVVDGGGDIASLAGTNDADQMAFSPDGKLLAVNFNGMIRLYDTASGNEVRQMPGGDGIESPLAFSPDGTLLATTANISEIKLLDVASGEERGIIKGHENWIQCLAFSPDGKMLASGSVDQSVRLWDVASGKMLRKLTGYTGQVDGVAWSPDGRLLASASWDLTVRLWRTDTWKEAAVLMGHADWVQQVAFSPDGLWLASAAISREVRVWSLQP